MQEMTCEICSKPIEGNDYVSEMNPFSFKDGWDYFHTNCYNDENQPMEIGTIKEGEYHPSADSAMEYVKLKMADMKAWSMTKEAMGSTALSGNRLSEICMSTINRLENGEPVSDRYLLGLAWLLKEMEEARHETNHNRI